MKYRNTVHIFLEVPYRKSTLPLRWKSATPLCKFDVVYVWFLGTFSRYKQMLTIIKGNELALVKRNSPLVMVTKVLLRCAEW